MNNLVYCLKYYNNMFKNKIKKLRKQIQLRYPKMEKYEHMVHFGVNYCSITFCLLLKDVSKLIVSLCNQKRPKLAPSSMC